jgi:hypothetical protein
MELMGHGNKYTSEKGQYSRADITRVLQTLDHDTRLIKSEVRSGSERLIMRLTVNPLFLTLIL